MDWPRGGLVLSGRWRHGAPSFDISVFVKPPLLYIAETTAVVVRGRLAEEEGKAWPGKWPSLYSHETQVYIILGRALDGRGRGVWAEKDMYLFYVGMWLTVMAAAGSSSQAWHRCLSFSPLPHLHIHTHPPSPTTAACPIRQVKIHHAAPCASPAFRGRGSNTRTRWTLWPGCRNDRRGHTTGTRGLYSAR